MLNKIQFGLVVSFSFIYILVDRIHQKKLEKEAFKNNENNVCSDQNVQNQIERSLQVEDVQFFSRGSHVAEDIIGWTTSDFPEPDLINFKLYPILRLFDKTIMTSKRLTDEEGRAIDIDDITSWMLPRYVAILNRCKTLDNYR